MKLGRNEPCHCGSGRKYKHCHYEADRAAEAAALKEAAAAAEAEAKAEAEAAEDVEGAHDDHSTARAESTGRPKPGGSRFFRDSGPGGRGAGRSQTGSSGSPTARTTRGAQRGS